MAKDSVEHLERPQRQPLLRSWRILAFQIAVVGAIAAGLWALGGDMPFPAPWRSSAPGGPAADFYSLGPTDEFRGDGPGIGKPAPDFALTTPDGDVIRLSDFTGKIVVLNFWATWCTPCRKEFPELVRAHDPSGGVVVIGVDLQENPSEVLAFAREYGAQYPILIDTDGSVADSYRLVGLPSTYFIDRAGILRAQQFGQLTQDLIRQRVAAAGAP